MERKFIQLYQIKPDWNFPGTTSCFLNNGLHYVWDEAQPEWLELKHGCMDDPPEADEVYITACGFVTLMKVLEWAKKAPQTKFMVGGPVPRIHNIRCLEEIPKNLIFSKDMAETLFNKEYNPNNFKLVPPPVQEGVRYTYAFPWNVFCRWGKCVYCTEPHEYARSWSLEPLEWAPTGNLYMGLSLGIPEIKQIAEMPFDRGNHYMFSIRADREYLPALRELSKKIPTNQISLKAGIEFPSNRMLRYMNKGLDLDNMIDFILGIHDMGFPLGFAFISHWGCLEEDDIVEARKFFNTIRGKFSVSTPFAVTPLLGYITLQDLNPDQFLPDPLLIGSFVLGYYIKQDETQKRLNDEWIRILKDEGKIRVRT